jgi:hypothetical protein
VIRREAAGLQVGLDLHDVSPCQNIYGIQRTATLGFAARPPAFCMFPGASLAKTRSRSNTGHDAKNIFGSAADAPIPAPRQVNPHRAKAKLRSAIDGQTFPHSDDQDGGDIPY